MQSSLRTDEEIEKIYNRHVDTVYRICYSFMKNTADAEDMVQETFLKLIISKRILRIAAAAAAVVILMPTAAYAIELFGLHEISLGERELEVPVRVTGEENGTEEKFEVKKEKVDMLSLQGMASSPEALACSEWLDFCENYDADGTIIAEIGNEPTEFSEEYGAYLCYTKEMADKIDELCEKYQLKKKEIPVIEDDYKTILSQAGIGDILKPSTEAINTMQGEICDSDGNFNLGGEILLPENPECIIIYELTRSVKGFFDTVALNVGNIEDYEQWEYKTENGETILLAKKGDSALIITDRNESFVSVSMEGYLQKQANSVWEPYEITKKDLEKIAETIDFSMIP